MSNTITKTYECDHCDHAEDITFKFDDYAHWKDGGLIQDDLDNLTPNQRELMLSRTCGKCFDEMFSSEEG